MGTVTLCSGANLAGYPLRIAAGTDGLRKSELRHLLAEK